LPSPDNGRILDDRRERNDPSEGDSMTRSRDSSSRTSALGPLLAVTLLVAGCGTATTSSSSGAASAAPSAAAIQTLPPTPSAAPTATATPTPTATASASASPSSPPSPSASIDPSADLKIAPPYALAPLDRITSAAMQGAMSQALGSLSSIVELGFRQATENGKATCIIMVMEFPSLGAATQPGFLDQLATGLKGATGKVSNATILGKPVRIVTNGTQAMGLYVRQEGVVVPICQSATAATAVTTALIKADQ
jgi:hypothetical protein